MITMSYNEECLMYLKEAQDYINNFKFIDAFDLIFNEDAEEIQTNIANNKASAEGAGGALKKALTAAKNMIVNMIKRIVGGIQKIFASKGEKNQYEQIKAAIAANPSLKNKQFTFYDFKHNKAQWDAIEQEAARADSMLAAGKDVAIDGILGKIKQYEGALKGTAQVLGAEAVLAACKGNRGMQQEIANRMNNDKDYMDKLEAELGKHEARKLRRQVNSYGDNKFFSLFGKRINLKREINRVRGKQCDTMLDAFDQVAQDILGNVERVNTAMQYQKNNDELYAQGGIKNFGKRIVNNAKSAAAVAGMANSSVVQRAVGNKGIMDTIKGVAKDSKGSRKSRKEKRKEMRQDYNAQKAADYDYKDKMTRYNKGDFSAQSAGSFITGKDKRQYEKEQNARRQAQMNARIGEDNSQY